MAMRRGADVPFPGTLTARDAGRRSGYGRFLDFYDGAQWEGRRVERERRLVYNYTQIIIDRAAAVLLHNMVMTVDRTPGSTEEEEGLARESIEELVRVNGLGTLDLETEIDCAVAGDAVYKVTWDVEAAQVRITSPDAARVWAWWRPDNVHLVTQVAEQYEMDAGRVEQLYGVVVPGDELTITERWTAATVEVWAGRDMVTSQANPYGFIPYVIMPNIRRPKKFWGESDIPVLQGITRELNRELSTLSAIMELSGNPVAVLEGVDAASNIAIAPGAVWELPVESKAYLLDLFSGGAVRAHVDYVSMLYRAMHDLAETPRSVFGDSQSTFSSGVAIELDMTPLLFKVRRKRLSRGLSYTERARMALRLLTLYAGLPDRKWGLTVQWGDVLPRDLTDEVRREQVRVESKTSSRQAAMERLGVPDSVAEFERILDEDARLAPAEGAEGEQDGGIERTAGLSGAGQAGE